MAEPPQSESALAFLRRFLIASTAISLAWEPLSGFYLATLLPAVNALLDTGAFSVRLEQRAHLVSLVLRGQDGSVYHLRFTGYELLHLHAVAAAALFAATPGLSRTSKARWIAALLALFWLSQVWSLYAGTLLALAEYWEQLPVPKQDALRQSGWPDLVDAANDGQRLYAWWNIWRGPTLALVLWIVATRHYWLPEKELLGEQSGAAVDDDSG